MKVLAIDDKWSVEYDPDNNDRPLRVLRYGEPCGGAEPCDWDNAVTAMFYALLGARGGEEAQGAVTVPGGSATYWPESEERDDKPVGRELGAIDRAMLQSMATSFRARMDFSFNPNDMANLLERCAESAHLDTHEVERLRASRFEVVTERNALQARVAEVEAERDAQSAVAFEAAANIIDSLIAGGHEVNGTALRRASGPAVSKAALDHIRAQAKAEGMRKAAKEAGRYLTVADAQEAILAAAEKELRHD